MWTWIIQHLNICVWVCVRVCVCVCFDVCLCVCVCVLLCFLCVSVCSIVCVCIQNLVCVCTCLFVCAHACARAHMHVWRTYLHVNAGSVYLRHLVGFLLFVFAFRAPGRAKPLPAVSQSDSSWPWRRTLLCIAKPHIMYVTMYVSPCTTTPMYSMSVVINVYI